MADEIEDLTTYIQLCAQASDINQHLPTLSRFAARSPVILEAGGRGVASTFAFINGQRYNQSSGKTIYSVDIEQVDVTFAVETATEHNIKLDFVQADILNYTLAQDVDLLFIDTFHCYGQLKRELAKFAPQTKKYIIMHDTTVDEFTSEATRLRFNITQIGRRLGWTEYELTTGLWPAIVDFLALNPEWKLHHRFRHNNGLTILKRKE